MRKTVVVKTETFKVCPKYRKRFRASKRYKADIGENTYKVGDRVLIEESKPISKDKCWRVKELLSKGESKEAKPEEA